MFNSPIFNFKDSKSSSHSSNDSDSDSSSDTPVPSICNMLKEHPEALNLLDLLESDPHFQRHRKDVYKDPAIKRKELQEKLKELQECEDVMLSAQERKWLIKTGM